MLIRASRARSIYMGRFNDKRLAMTVVNPKLAVTKRSYTRRPSNLPPPANGFDDRGAAVRGGSVTST